MKTRAAVQTADRTIEHRIFEVPDNLGPGHAVLRVEANGICGTDHEQYDGALTDAGIFTYPLIPGHEPVGVIERIGDEAASMWGLEVGDRVAVEAFVPCHGCKACWRGRTRFCTNLFRYGFTGLDVGCGLWGGFAEHMVLRPNSVLHRLPLDMTVEDAVLFNPMGAGFSWVQRAGTGLGDTLLVLGPGQRGLACLLAGLEMGARRVFVTGLERDRAKLDLALAFGADAVIVADTEDVVARVNELTDGELVDQVVDTTPYATAAIMQAVRSVRGGGTIVLGGVKGMKAVPDFISDMVVLRDLTIHGVISADTWAYERAIDLVQSGTYPLDRMHSHTLTLDDVEHGIRLLAGEETTTTPVVHITITP